MSSMQTPLHPISRSTQRGWRAALPAVLGFVVLWIVNFETFRKHYQGKTTFPWDFLGGYHAQAFGWYDMGSLVSPPSWLPWTDMGFPAFLAIQSGGWYLPLALLHALGIVYSVHAATMVQVFHVLLGAMGAFMLARRLGACLLVALIAGLAYHFQAAFFSNQQHVDIVRASAWFPWLLFVLHPQTYARGWLGSLLSAFVLSQLLISGYPGAIVAFAYASAIWVLMFMGAEEGRHDRQRYGLLVTTSVAGGILMAMPKWMPFLLNGSADITLDAFAVSPVDPATLLTMLLPHSSPALLGDPTMRSLWLPLVALWGIVFAPLRDRVVQTGISLLVLGLVFCYLVPRAPLFAQWLPGISLSRFPLADWRPVIALGILIPALAGWQEFFTRQWSTGQVSVRTIIALALCLAVAIYAIHFGFEASSLTLALGFTAAIAVITVVGHAYWVVRANVTWPQTSALLLLTLATALHGYWYQRAQPDTWRPTWNKAAEIQSFGGRFKDFMKARHSETTIIRRPARMLIGNDPESVLRQHNSSHYNQCYYMHTYCVFGYDNLKMSAPHRILLAAVSAPGGESLLRFIARPQQLLMLEEGQGGDEVPDLSASKEDAPAVGDVDGASVDFIDYGPGYTTYRISAPRRLRVVENEIGWHGWQMSRCDDRGTCTAPMPVAMTSQGLRTWKVPAGNWKLILRFVGPSNVPGYICLFAGILLTLAAGGWACRQRTRLK